MMVRKSIISVMRFLPYFEILHRKRGKRTLGRNSTPKPKDFAINICFVCVFFFWTNVLYVLGKEKTHMSPR